MEVFCILIFGFGFLRTLFPFLNKKSFETFPVFFGVFVNASSYCICYVWFLNYMLNK